jgi:hypothetical protein
MANTINVPKSHLIIGLSLPLAVLIGYFLAEPLELGSMAVVITVLAVLSIPLVIRWYYPILVFCWCAALKPIVLPGRADMWTLMAFLGVLIAVLSRAVNPKARLISVPSVTRPLLLLAAVAVATAMLTGGFGARSFGSEHYGGKRYFYLFAAVAGYFALTSRRIPPERAGLYVGIFFLSAITNCVGNLAVAAGPHFHFLLAVFSPDFVQDQMTLGTSSWSGMVRVRGLAVMASGVSCYLLARYGIAGLLEIKKPWRMLLFLCVATAGLLGGFRSYLAQFLLIVAVLFIIEGLHRTRLLPMLLSLALLGAVIVLPQAQRLPLVVQRSMAFLPGNFDAAARESASNSTEWRLLMWRQIWPEVPRYLFRGKGFGLDSGDLYLAGVAERRFQSEALAGTITAGDYHNGPLSILIPLGIYGMIAFVWFLIAAIRVLHRNWKYGNPAYERINALLLAAFIAHAIFFFVGFGAISSDLGVFVGWLGLGIALNGAEAYQPATVEEVASGVELNTEYIKA